MATSESKSKIPSFWLSIWVIVYTMILFFGLFHPNNFFTTSIKLSSILLCLIYTIVYAYHDKLLILAMSTTLIADIILATDNIAIIGLLFFLTTQFIHLVRLTKPQNKKLQIKITLFITFSIVLITLSLITNIVQPIFVIAALYLLALCTNIYISWRWKRQERHNFHAFSAFWGFVLFLACDLCVGVSYLSLIHFFTDFFYQPANFLAWVFYCPAQIFLSNSTKHDKMVTKERKLCYNGGNYGR